MQGQERHESQPPPFQAPSFEPGFDVDAGGAQFAPGQWQDPRTQLHGNVEKFMGIVYGWMAAAIAVTALVVWGIVSSPKAIEVVYGIDVLTGTRTGGGIHTILLFAPLVFVMIFGSRITGMRPAMAGGLLLTYAALIGGAISYVPLVYDAGSIAGSFGVASAMFAAMSAFGYFTKKDLSGMGRFLSMAVIGLLFAWLASLIWPQIYFWIAAIGVFVFAGLTAYDTQNIKQMYLVHGGRGNLAVVGALMLYVSLVNIFLFLLSLFGGRD